MSFDKTVKNACKPKKDVPKAKVRFVHFYAYSYTVPCLLSADEAVRGRLMRGVEC